MHAGVKYDQRGTGNPWYFNFVFGLRWIRISGWFHFQIPATLGLDINWKCFFSMKRSACELIKRICRENFVRLLFSCADKR